MAIIQKKIYDSETILMISNGEIEDIMKIVKSLKKFGLLIQDVSEKNCKWSTRIQRWIS